MILRLQSVCLVSLVTTDEAAAVGRVLFSVVSKGVVVFYAANQRRGSGDIAMPVKDKEVLKRRHKFPFSRRRAERTPTSIA
jgi:hypothetical protein